MCRGGLRQISAVIDKVLRETWGREEVCSRRMRKGSARSDSILCCSECQLLLVHVIENHVLLTRHCYCFVQCL